MSALNSPVFSSISLDAVSWLPGSGVCDRQSPAADLHGTRGIEKKEILIVTSHRDFGVLCYHCTAWPILADPQQ